MNFEVALKCCKIVLFCEKIFPVDFLLKIMYFVIGLVERPRSIYCEEVPRFFL